MINKVRLTNSLIPIVISVFAITLFALLAATSQADNGLTGPRLAAASGSSLQSGSDTGQGQVAHPGQAGTPKAVSPRGDTGKVPGQSRVGQRPISGEEQGQGAYCNRVCLSMPDLWDMSCASVCTN